ncbi:MAG: phytoene desaturase family protein [Saprospiraceae bacterium]
MRKTVNIIGSGFAGLSAACMLAKEGIQVKVFEKNEQIGGRARQFSAAGFTFDMGPSWYWMPDVFEDFFQQFGKSVSDYYDLRQLDPGFCIYFGKGDKMDIPANEVEIYDLFEKIEKGSAKRLKQFLKEAAYKYEVGMKDLVYQPSHSHLEFIDIRLIKSVFKMGVFESFSKHARKFFTNPKLLQLIEFPVLFLGAMPKDTPALYSLMNYSALSQGTWYPMGGMHKIVEGLKTLADSLGVEFHTDMDVAQIEVEQKTAKGITVNGEFYPADFTLSTADYHFSETQLLAKEHQSYSAKYWDSRVMAPSSLLFYLGVDKKIEGLEHHNLFFDAPFEAHAEKIYKTPGYPENPLFYACCPSKTDASVAPAGKENLFLLIPLAPDLEDNATIREKYYEKVMTRLESLLGVDIKKSVIYKRSYAIKDFKQDYNAFKGNAYGLANTLLQTASLKPKLRSKKVKNLYYAGQLTVPGPGVPPSLISGTVAAREITKRISQTTQIFDYEKTV